MRKPFHSICANLGRALTDDANKRGCFRVDQLLTERLGRDVYSIGDIGELDGSDSARVLESFWTAAAN